MRFGGLAAMVLICSAGTGCGADESEPQGCVPGASAECTGVDGCSGYQLCEEDGRAYGPCQCGGASGASGSSGAPGGGAPSTSGGSSGAGGSGAASGADTGGSGGSGGGSGGEVGGTGGDSVAGAAGSPIECAPADMSDWTPPPYVPARTTAAGCTEAVIRQYVAECLSGADCAAFETGGQHADCGSCLSPTPIDSSEYGPLVLVGSVRETNFAGCIELMGEAACAEHQQAKSDCTREACAANCPVTDSESLADFQQCREEARTGVCDAYREAAVCITSTDHVDACSGDTFEDAAVSLGLVFCGG